eukprot:415668-Pyramimonas_sp.AAC.1
MLLPLKRWPHFCASGRSKLCYCCIVLEEVSGGSPVSTLQRRSPPHGDLSGEPRKLNKEPRLQTGPDPSKTVNSKEPGAMPSHAARCCVLCRCAMPCFALQC